MVSFSLALQCRGMALFRTRINFDGYTADSVVFGMGQEFGPS